MKALMNYPHRIRLRGPWDCEPLPGGRERRVAMPCRWAEVFPDGYRGTARFRRKFGYPGRIDPSEHVWLTCAGCTGCREILLNEQVLTSNPWEQWEFEVTALLGARNRLEVLVEGDSDAAGLWGEVALEIRQSAWLSAMQLQRTDTGLRVSGTVVGSAPQPLELYTLVAGRHADYRTLQPTADGQPFQIDLADTAAAPPPVRVELVHVSSIWYAVELMPD